MYRAPLVARFRVRSAALAGLVFLAGCAGAATTAPPTASPTSNAAAPVSTGVVHEVSGSATGTVALFHKADGSFVVTFEDFSIDSIAHTNVILVPNRDVTSDGDIDESTIVDLGPLKGATGMQDFVVPSSADAMTYHTVVLWDTEMAHAIAAAPLQ